MKNLIVTRADENIEEMSLLTHPILRQYAAHVGADFEVISDEIPGLHRHWRIFKLNDFFDEYDRIFCIDTDVLINPHCSNIFDEVPYNKIGTIFEDRGTRKKDRRQKILRIQELLGDIGWRTGYINTGVSIFSKCHRDIFNYRIEDLPIEDIGYDDVYLGYQIRKLGYEIQELDCRWNFMTMFAEKSVFWERYRWDAYIMHYAGVGLFVPCRSRLELMKQDALLWYWHP